MNIGVISNRYIRVSEPLAYYGNRNTGVKCLRSKGVTKLVKCERLVDTGIRQYATQNTAASWSLLSVCTLERRYRNRNR